MVPCKNTAEEVSFEWSHHRISSTDPKVTTTLHVSIIYSGIKRLKGGIVSIVTRLSFVQRRHLEFRRLPESFRRYSKIARKRSANDIGANYGPNVALRIPKITRKLTRLSEDCSKTYKNFQRSSDFFFFYLKILSAYTKKSCKW